MFFFSFRPHGVGRAFTSDWYKNSFVMLVYEKKNVLVDRILDRNFSLNFKKKNFKKFFS